jgi:hypothetical protein
VTGTEASRDVAAGPAATLNENQRRRVASTFSYIDALLQSVERLAHAQPTEFTRERPDLTETESRLLLSLTEAARTRMLATMDHLGLERPSANLSARWSITTTFRFIDIALSELTPKTLAGYGAIDERSASEVSAVTSDLRELVARGRELLQPHEGEKLRLRLAGIPGPLGEVLRAAEEASRRLGVVEVRSLIAAAADRATTDTIAVGVFGRVSSGKSSLINALIGEPVLPVGATPVTAVPLRVEHGGASIDVLFADGRSDGIDVAQLPEYATEAGNRDNARRVQSITIHTPRLVEGLALLDTPGVGSLSHSGPAQAFAWLPRCDVGIVLVAAGTPLGRDEFALVSGLTQAGIEVEILLSKSDLLSESERSSALEYVRSELTRAAGAANVSVRPVSVVPTELYLLERWRDERLVPLIAARQRVAEHARARRMHALLGALNAAMRQRGPLDRAGIDLHRIRNDAEHEIAAAAEELEAAVYDSLHAAADAVAEAWNAGADARGAARRALLEPPTRALSRARVAADRALEHVELPEQEAAARIPPLFDPPWLDALPIARSAGLFDRLFARGRARQQLARLAKPVNDAYGTYANRIRAWGRERLDENFRRVTALRTRAGSPLVPELEDLSRLIEAYFPSAG